MEEEPMMSHGFLTGQKHGIFTDGNEGNNYTCKEDDNTMINSNKNPTSQKTKGKKHKRDSKKKSKPTHIINSAIKYQNNKKKKRKKIKPTTSKPKTSTSNSLHDLALVFKP